ncbi:MULTISPECIES: hypothetical protein [Nostoc]|uniref:Uncharacterized protein n=1 Tax=Nostoc paludosum FACHB-159 TaxID=2692908 RepID=A0ABR8K743_9NOSO|nr:MULTISPECIES: hypothetical protein [Nostoc]MBD2734611.1 hypothetical protein [Nostoc paludosum FACHB-159]
MSIGHWAWGIGHWVRKYFFPKYLFPSHQSPIPSPQSPVPSPPSPMPHFPFIPKDDNPILSQGGGIG